MLLESLGEAGEELPPPDAAASGSGIRDEGIYLVNRREERAVLASRQAVHEIADGTPGKPRGHLGRCPRDKQRDRIWVLLGHGREREGHAASQVSHGKDV